MADLSKIQFGISKAYVAVIKDDGTYDTPFAIPGAVTLNINREGSEPEKFYADNIAYYVTPAVNSGYSGTFTLAKVSDLFRQKVLGEIVDDNGIQIEVSDAIIKNFALMYEVQGDVDQKRYVFYNCTAQRVAASSNTKSESTNPDTQDLEFTAIGKDFTLAGETRNVVKGSACTSDAAFSSWYTAVPTPVISGGATGDTGQSQ